MKPISKHVSIVYVPRSEWTHTGLVKQVLYCYTAVLMKLPATPASYRCAFEIVSILRTLDISDHMCAIVGFSANVTNIH